jgi:hypothetical protein
MTSLHDAPSAPDLVEAVREFLERDVIGATTGRTQFHTKVAIRVLAMVERELRDGARLEAAHLERLQALGFATDEDLALAIRAGELDDRYDEVRAVVAAAVDAKLRIANPAYLESPASGETDTAQGETDTAQGESGAAGASGDGDV